MLATQVVSYTMQGALRATAPRTHLAGGKKLSTRSRAIATAPAANACNARARWSGQLLIARAAAAQGTSSQVEALRHITEDGWGLELLLQRAAPQQAGEDSTKPPLLFIHGSYHAAWCYAEKFLPWFAAKGYDTYAVSLRAQGNSDCVSQDKEGPIQVAGTLDSHVKDLSDLLQGFPRPPVIIAHSFGGLILQKYVLGMAPSPGAQGHPYLAGVGYLACVPPSGNKDMIIRFLKRNLWVSLKVTWGFVARSFVDSIDTCRDLFFSPDLPREDLERYHKQLAACSPVRLIDLSDVNKQVPLPAPPAHSPSAFVLGGADDVVVDVEAIRELADACKVQPVILPNMAHDVMLDTRWEQTASELHAWLSKL